MATGQKLRGFVGQGLSGRRKPARPRLYRITLVTAGAYRIAADYNGYVDIFIWGAGASGLGNGALGGGSGGAIYRRIAVRKGQQIAGAVGAKGAASAGNRNAGGDSTITFPDGLVGVATGAPNDGSGGVPVPNGDIVVRNGSAATVAGMDGGGAAGSTGGGGEEGGGGPPGFGTYVTGLTYGVGATTGGSPATRGGGGSGNNSGVSGAGGDGVLQAFWYRLD